MALVDGHLGVAKLRTEKASLDAAGVIGVHFLRRFSRSVQVQVHKILVTILVARRLIVQVGKTLAAGVLALGVAGAVAATEEAVLGGMDAAAQEDAVNEAKVPGQDLLVDVVDDSDGDPLVSGKGADLTPVAVCSLLVVTVWGEGVGKRSERV